MWSQIKSNHFIAKNMRITIYISVVKTKIRELFQQWSQMKQSLYRVLTPSELNHNDFRWQTEQSDKTQFINKTQNRTNRDQKRKDIEKHMK